jgi:hypothetical protein
MGDLRLGLRTEQVIGALARAGFHELRTTATHDRYRIADGDGVATEFPMFLVAGRKPLELPAGDR